MIRYILSSLAAWGGGCFAGYFFSERIGAFSIQRFMKTNPIGWLLLAAAGFFMETSSSSLKADEGMWLFNNPPRKQLKELYGFDATDAWLEHVQRSSVRFNSGGSGSFVSEDGLVLSNHHVGADALQKFGDATHNYLRDGFHA